MIRNIGRALGVPPGLLLAAALEETTTDGFDSDEAAELARSFKALLRATHHLVLSERLDREHIERPASTTTRKVSSNRRARKA